MLNNKIGKNLFRKVFGWYMLLALILTAFQLFVEYKDTKNALKEELNFLSSAFYDTLNNSIWNLDETQINGSVDALVSLESVEGVSIVDPKHNVLVQKGALPKKVMNDSGYFKKSFDLIHKEGDQEEILATVTLYSSQDVVFSRLETSILLIVGIAIIKSVFLLFIFLYFTNNILSKPLSSLIEAIKKINPTGYQKIKPLINQDDELALLTQEYNKMGERLTTIFSQKKEFEEKLAQEHKYLQSIIDSVDDPIMVIGKDYEVKLMNRYLSKNLQHHDIVDINHPKCYEIAQNCSYPCCGATNHCPMGTVIDSKKSMIVVHEREDTQGNIRFKEISATPLFDQERNCIGIIESSKDITAELQVKHELQEKKESLNYQTHYDSLTALPNRALFKNKLAYKIKKASQKQTEFALLFIDLDRFKQINDSLGHEIGDLVLLEVTKRFKKIISNEDILARLGSDEFAIVKDNLSDREEVSELAQTILDIFSQPVVIQEHTLYLSCSIGISLYPQDDEVEYNLLKYADTAMYQAKDEGRNNYQYYSSEMTQLVFEKVLMETNLRKAIHDEEFVVFYQPQIDSADGTVVGMEALVRWIHPDIGMVSPVKFIPLAEETGLIVEIDRWVMKTAMKQVKQWHDEGLNPGVLSLNLASKQLETPDFIDYLQNSMKERSFQPSWLKLEVTESDVMLDPKKAIIKLQHINDLGVKIAIDDFGTGYSSLAYLKRLPITTLKIDQSFIRDIQTDKDDIAIVKAVIALARSLSLDTVAEGVETIEQKELLNQHGCDVIQGYFYSKPISAYAFKKYLALL